MTHQMDYLHEQLNNARIAVEHKQQNNTGYAEAQQFIKLAEEALNEVMINPDSEVDKKEIQRATDLLRLLEETNQATT
ncbi:hypothetical protein ABFG93_22285 (plasmid) [Pseudalkalibacillus hwajinpoensis]|uniref:hypothetical protein n=1 Tax=Guptibacillus hwajinpoensis TaxID=208199 RepID=UPI00325B184F